jgi:hypothetical protein
MSHPSPLPPPANLPMTWTPSSRPVLRFTTMLHPTPLLLQVPRRLSPCHVRPRRHSLRLHPLHARPRLHASPPGVPATTTPTSKPSRVGPSIYHPIAVARDPRNTHPMATHRAAGVTKLMDCLQLSAAVASPTLFPVPSSVRSALTDPH